MEKIIYAIGYGIIKGTWPEKKAKFQERLASVQRGIGKSVAVVDIRQTGCGSRNGPAFEMGSWGVAGTVRELGMVYTAETDLSNPYGGAKWQLKMYVEDLVDCVDGNYGDNEIKQAFGRVKAIAKADERAVILLCGCRDAYKKNGTTWNCHRVPLADALVKELGEGWSVVHL